MLKDIKSSYFIQMIFVYINEKQKLKLIKYNKHLQKTLNLSIIDYKLFTGKYIIYGENGIGKEYYGENELLIFEGEFLNGVRNGKGKEYRDNGKIYFEGEYFNGKELNGIRYDNNDNIIYEVNNDINGKGKEYYWNGQLKFKGEYLNGKRNGKGKEYTGTLIFEGEYKNNLKWNGKGYIISNIIKYELKDGKGYIKEYHWYNSNLEFECEYLNGQRNGKGKEYYDNKLRFEGEYLNGQRNGKGIEYGFGGDIVYEGEYSNGKKMEKEKNIMVMMVH